MWRQQQQQQQQQCLWHIKALTNMNAFSVPKPECTDNSECTNDKACINEACRNPCTEIPNTCGINALCHVQLHHPLCVCRDGFTGNAQGQCYESKYCRKKLFLELHFFVLIQVSHYNVFTVVLLNLFTA